MAGRVVYHGGLVTDGLILHLDAARKPSYPGSGDVCYDLSGNGNHGTLINGTSFDKNKNNGTFEFDGSNDYIDIPHFDVTENITVDVWFKKTSGTSWQGWVGNWNGIGAGDSWLLTQDSSNRPAFYTRSAADSPRPTLIHSTTILSDVWYNYVGVVEGTDQFLYKNGVLVNSNTSNEIGFYQNSNNIWVGKFYSFEFNGDLPATKVYNRALSAEEVLQNYNALKGRFGL